MSLTLDFSKGIVKQQIADLPDKIKEASLEVLDQTADQMVNISKSLCPVDTGSLQKSIRKERSADRISVRAGGYVTNPKTRRIVNYAAIVELYQPFMRPAWAMVREQALQQIKQNIVEKSQK